MKSMTNQAGVGMVEVLVALLILAIGVLGFVALQYRAVEATAESANRVQAINFARDLAERIRVNRSAYTTYDTQISTAANQASSAQNCASQYCSPAQLADYDVSQMQAKINDAGMSFNLLPCQGNNNGRECIYIAWGDTAATNGTADGEGNCTTENSYDPVSTCIIMEVY